MAVPLRDKVPDVIRFIGVVEYQQPASVLVTLLKELEEPGVPAFAGRPGHVGDLEPGLQVRQSLARGFRGIAGKPPDQVIVGLVANGVLDSQLGLSYTAEPLNRYRACPAIGGPGPGGPGPPCPPPP